MQNRYVEWGAGMPDLDNDGLPDLVYVTGNVYPEVEARLPEYPYKGPIIVFRNRDGTRFDDVTTTSGPGVTQPRSSRGAAFGDFDNDGDVDVLVMNMNEPPALLRNDYAGSNRWLAVQLEGRASNRSAIGATVRVTVGGPHAGAGGAESVELLQPRRPAAAFRAGRARGRGANRGALAERRRDRPGTVFRRGSSLRDSRVAAPAIPTGVHWSGSRSHPRSISLLDGAPIATKFCSKPSAKLDCLTSVFSLDVDATYYSNVATQRGRRIPSGPAPLAPASGDVESARHRSHHASTRPE